MFWDSLRYTKLSSNSLHSQGLPWPSYSPVSTQVLGLRVCNAVPILCGAGDETQGSMHGRQALYQLSYILGPTSTVIFKSAYIF